MTLEELKKNWKNYALKLLDGETLVMEKTYAHVSGEFKGGLLFEIKDELFKDCCDLLRADENSICYTKISINGEILDVWIPIGRFVKLSKTKKEER